jgi:hypothetical protein
VSLCAEESQNINDIFKNINGICRNINGICRNIIDILSFFRRQSQFIVHMTEVDDAVARS